MMNKLDRTPASKVLKLRIDARRSNTLYRPQFELLESRIALSVLFGAEDPINGRELWISDGTNTRLFADINPIGSSSPVSLLEHGGSVFFGGNNGAAGVVAADCVDPPQYD